MTGITVDSVRDCLEGTVPGVVATCSADGTPNVAYLSQVEYVDARHVALSFQFFNKTRQNILANPVAELLVIHPVSAAMYRMRRALPAHRDRRAAVRAHEGQAGRHRIAHRHGRRVQAARRRRV